MTLGNWKREPSNGSTHLGQGFAGESAERHRRGDKGRRPREHGEDRKHCPAHHLLPLPSRRLSLCLYVKLREEEGNLEDEFLQSSRK